MFDYYLKGHIQGHADAKDGKPKNLEHGMPIVPAIFSDHAVSSYCNGYSSGYDKGTRERYKELENEREQKLSSNNEANRLNR